MSRAATGYPVGAYSVRGQKAYTKADFLRTRLVFKLLALGAFSVVMALAYIWTHVQVLQVGYEINALKLQRDQLDDDTKQLQVELSWLGSPERLQTFAGQKMQMALPSPDRIVKTAVDSH